MADLARLAREAGPSPGKMPAAPRLGTATASEASRVSEALTQTLKAEWSSFGADDVARIAGVFGSLSHKHPPLLEAVAAHALRGLLVYPFYALCNIANSFARLNYHHRPLFDALAVHLAAPARASRLSPVDVASLVFAYAQLAHQAGALLEACATRLKTANTHVDGPNCAIILNSYARLRECDPELFSAMARAVVQTEPGSFAVHNISVIMNAFAKCGMRKAHLMHLLAGYLDGRVGEMSPQNVVNVTNAFARLELYSPQLFFAIRGRLMSEDLGEYKLYELANLAHSIAKLSSGGLKIYRALFDELARRPREDWEPRSVAQVLDAMRRAGRKHRGSFDDELILALMWAFVEHLPAYDVQGLTQSAWCLVELDALGLAAQVPQDLLEGEEDERPSQRFMRRILERMEELDKASPLTTTQKCFLQQMVRSYHYAHEVEYGLQPQHVKVFCKALFDVPTTVASAAMRRMRPGPPRHDSRG